ncbi:hypothetical protein DTO96_101412 [Ephemeroptericola cinctiostellae]|uniref:LysM domain-containing protein n=1 Tax=Ephemeroptericola cinctiostellae TaxID=2268024 RepID=A0A345DBE3_9BURK|nr:hypothetical protein [Ephemeroptericola cinctiostellae]AXF85681.1 hypothetical protein DTO96_101412 [Ephemeroptericola cinctiostellae]
MNTPRLSKFKLNVVLHISAAAAVASSLVCLPSVYAQEVKPAAPTLGVDGSVTMIIRKGHNVREIAKRYSRAHNVPFNATLTGLLAANPNAFIKNDPDVLIIGAPFVLPSRAQLLGLQPLNAINAAKAEVATPTAGVPDEKKAVETMPVPAAASTVNTSNAPAIVTAGTADGAKSNLDSTLPMPIWAMCLIAIALLMLCVRMFRRSAQEPLLDVDEDKDQKSSTLNPPTVHVDLTKKEVEVSPFEHSSSDDNVQANDADQHSPALSAVDNQAGVKEKDFERVEFESNLLEGAQIKMVQRAAITSLSAVEPSISTTHPAFSHNTFGNVNLEAIAADTSVEADLAAETDHIIEAQTVEQIAIETPSMNAITPKNGTIVPLSKGLDLDVSGFMKRYTNQMPPMRVQPSLDFEDLLDRAHLQAWLNQNTPEDVLLHAQDAHEERYGEVAEAMLADVLFRGDAEQCAMAVRLRKEWSTPRPL